jgi:hypothetical protein
VGGGALGFLKEQFNLHIGHDNVMKGWSEGYSCSLL